MRYPDDAATLSPQGRQHIYAEAGRSFAALPGRAFVRVLLPVRLTDGHEFHFGVWMEMSEPVGRRVWEAWETEAYGNLVVEGTLANSVPPWGHALLGAECRAAVGDPQALPSIRESSHPALHRVLTEPWSRAECEAMITQVWGGA